MAKKNEKIGKVPNRRYPRLRFPGFEEEWTEMALRNLGEFIGGGTPSSTNRSYWNGDIPWISSSDINEGNIHDVKISRFISQQAVDKCATKLCSAPVILIVSRVGVGKLAHYTKSVCTSQDFTNIVNVHCNSLFLTYLLSIIMKRKASNTQGTSIKGITIEEIKNIKLSIPSNPEQCKVASFLKSIDTRIATQNKIIEELTLLRNTISNKIFSFEFKLKDAEGRNFPKWELKKLGEIGETYNGLTGKTKEDFGTGKPYIQYKQIFDKSEIDLSKCDLVKVTNGGNQNRVKKGDVFFTVSSETPDEIGMSSVLLDDVDEMYLNSFCFGYRPHSIEILNPSFARYFFRSEAFRNEIIKLAQGSTRYNMSKIALMKLKIYLPCIEEQIKIANFISALSYKIEIQNSLLQYLRNQKQYLLQNLFI